MFMEAYKRKLFSKFVLPIMLSALIVCGALVPALAFASSTIDVWWPTNGAHVSGVQPFKAMIPGLETSQYQMFWQVDGGQWNWMSENDTDSPHMEASVDLTNWTWHGSGPYAVNFIARQGNQIISQQSEQIYVNNSQSPLLTSSQTNLQANNQTQNQSVSSTNFYVVPNTEASLQEKVWQGNNDTDANAMQTLASQPTAVWFGNWNSDVQDDVHSLVAAAQASNETPVLVAYNIPQRDCGSFSAGGANNPDGYKSWIDSFSSGLGQSPAIVILEPDALAEISCLSSADQATREQLLSYAVSSIKKDGKARVYIDAGHSDWIDAKTMAQSLQQAGISQADGFSLNVSNFMPTSGEITYGEQVSALVGGKHFVIDTSRNGGSVASGQWCNPSGAMIGAKPTTNTGNGIVDAYLWIKTPGESDGSCNGGPSAGTWWPSYALALVLGN